MQTVALSMGAVLLLAAASVVQAQTNPKVGFVNLNAILQNAPQLPSLNTLLRDEFAPRDAAFQASQEEYNERVETYERDQDVMSQAERTALERQLTQMQRDLERDAATLQEDLQIRQNELINEMQVEIVEKIQAYAELNDYDIIVTEAVYASEAVNITAQVYEAISAAIAPPAENISDD